MRWLQAADARSESVDIKHENIHHEDQCWFCQTLHEAQRVTMWRTLISKSLVGGSDRTRTSSEPAVM